MGMPRFEAAVVGGAELAWFIPLAAAGVACGWAFCASDKASAAASRAMGDRPVIKALLAGLLLSICGTVLPFSLFAGESQTQMVMDSYAALGAATLIATAFVKAALTPAFISGGAADISFPLFFRGCAWAMVSRSLRASMRFSARRYASRRSWARSCANP